MSGYLFGHRQKLLKGKPISMKNWKRRGTRIHKESKKFPFTLDYLAQEKHENHTDQRERLPVTRMG